MIYILCEHQIVYKKVDILYEISGLVYKSDLLKNHKKVFFRIYVFVFDRIENSLEKSVIFNFSPKNPSHKS